jgi:hypothetical protein
MLAYSRGTTTAAGLTETAVPDEGAYLEGLKVTTEDSKKLSIEYHDANPRWNYSISPRSGMS